MIQSAVLNSYSPILIPVSFIFGLNFIEKDLIYSNNFSYIGILLVISSLLLLSDRVKEPKNRDRLIAGCVLFGVSYISLRYFKLLHKLSIAAIIVSIFMIGESIIEYDIMNERAQQVYISLFVLFIYLVIILPKEHDNAQPFSLSVLLPSIFYTIIVLNTIEINQLKTG